MSRARYAAPDGSSADYAAFRRRLAAGAIDWGLLFFVYLIVSIPVGVVQLVGELSRRENDLGGIPGGIVVIAAQGLVVSPIPA